MLARPDYNVGRGRIVVELLGREAVLRQLSYNYPLKLLSPRCHRHATAIAYMVTYGGGLVGGDAVYLDITVNHDAALMLLTQGSTKVFETRTGDQTSRCYSTDNPREGTTTQQMNVNVQENGLLLLLPDAVTCFSNASYAQRQTFHLAHGSSAVLLDWLTSGRMYNDEQWKFLRYSSINEVWVDGKRVARDAVLLESEHGASSHHRTLQDRQGVYSCYATAILSGPKVQRGVASLSEEFQSNTLFRLHSPDDLVWSVARIPSGCVTRVAGRTTEIVKDWLKERMRFLEEVVGEDVYSKAFV